VTAPQQEAIERLIAWAHERRFDHRPFLEDACDAASAELASLRAELERLRRICHDSFLILPVVSDNYMCMAFVDSDITPHVRQVADEVAVLRAQVQAFKSGETELRAAIAAKEAALRAAREWIVDSWSEAEAPAVLHEIDAALTAPASGEAER